MRSRFMPQTSCGVVLGKVVKGAVRQDEAVGDGAWLVAVPGQQVADLLLRANRMARVGVFAEALPSGSGGCVDRVLDG